MSYNLAKQLDEHFAEVDSAQKKAEDRRREGEASDELRRSQFEKVRQAVIIPAMTQVRDLLLSRNLPAELVDETKRFAGRPPSLMLALHASSDVAHARTVAQDPMFRVGFQMISSGVKFYASRFLVEGVRKDTFETDLLLTDLNSERVSELLLGAIKAMFPA